MNGKMIVSGLCCLFNIMAYGTPTEMREWNSTNGTKVNGRVLEIVADKALVEREDGKKVNVPLSTFVEEDREFLSRHFGEMESPKAGALKGSDAKEASNLPYPTGEVSGPIEGGPDSHCFVFLPKSLKEGRMAPLMFFPNAGGGKESSLAPFLAMAEIGGWIAAVSVESTNKLGYPMSQAAAEVAAN